MTYAEAKQLPPAEFFGFRMAYLYGVPVDRENSKDQAAYDRGFKLGLENKDTIDRALIQGRGL